MEHCFLAGSCCSPPSFSYSGESSPIVTCCTCLIEESLFGKGFTSLVLKYWNRGLYPVDKCRCCEVDSTLPCERCMAAMQPCRYRYTLCWTKLCHSRLLDVIDNAYVIVEFENGSRGMLDLCMFAEGSKMSKKYRLLVTQEREHCAFRNSARGKRRC